MGMSESHDIKAENAGREGHNKADRVTLASLRSQFTSADTSTLDEALGTRARFRQEERLRADLRRERRLRQQAITERVEARLDQKFGPVRCTIHLEPRDYVEDGITYTGAHG